MTLNFLLGVTSSVAVLVVFIAWLLLSFPDLLGCEVRVAGVDVWLWALGQVRAMFRSLQLRSDATGDRNTDQQR